jgi:hypothetical protein
MARIVFCKRSELSKGPGPTRLRPFFEEGRGGGIDRSLDRVPLRPGLGRPGRQPEVADPGFQRGRDRRRAFAGLGRAVRRGRGDRGASDGPSRLSRPGPVVDRAEPGDPGADPGVGSTVRAEPYDSFAVVHTGRHLAVRCGDSGRVAVRAGVGRHRARLRRSVDAGPFSTGGRGLDACAAAPSS